MLLAFLLLLCMLCFFLLCVLFTVYWLLCCCLLVFLVSCWLGCFGCFCFCVCFRFCLWGGLFAPPKIGASCLVVLLANALWLVDFLVAYNPLCVPFWLLKWPYRGLKCDVKGALWAFILFIVALFCPVSLFTFVFVGFF